MKYNRVLSLLLACTMVLALLPVSGCAQEGETGCYVVFGDSIASGFGLENFGSLPSEDLANKNSTKNFANMLGAETGYAVKNFAVSGLDTAGLLSLLDGLTQPDCAEQLRAVESAELITVSIGGNDLLMPLVDYLNKQASDSTDAIAALVEVLSDAHSMRELSQLFAEGVKRFAGEEGKEGEFLQVVRTIREYNPDAKLLVQTIYDPLDGVLIMPGFLGNSIKEINDCIRTSGQDGELYTVADVAGAFKENDNPSSLTYFSSQEHPYDVHPTEAGHRVIFQTLLEAGGFGAATAVLRDNAENIKYIEGFGDEFQPDRAITRYEMIAALDKLYEVNMPGAETRLSDVASEYRQIVAEFEAAGVITGFEDGTFRGEAGLTRAEFTKVMSVLTGLAPSGEASRFADCAGHWAQGYVDVITGAGYIMGDAEGNFRPDDSLTRAEFVTLVNRVVGIAAGSCEQRFYDLPPEHWAFAQIMAACQ